MIGLRRTLLVALIAFVAAIAGVWLGRAVLAPKTVADSELHALLHDQLNLDPAQHAKLDVLEAQFAGVPVVSTACTGPEDLIEDGVTGLLRPVGDADGLTQAVLGLLRDTSGARALGGD